MGHRLGQVFLKDRNIIQKIMDEASITDQDHVVEIGCGQGWLSKNIAQRAKKLTIIELDEPYLNETKDCLAEFSHVTYRHEDALAVDYTQLGNTYKIVTNLPYYISAKFTQLLVENTAYINLAIVMVQHEFAKKLVAKPGDKLYCSLGVYANFYLDIRYAFKVAKTCFRPVPKIDSAVLTMAPRKTPLYAVDADLFFAITKSAFWGRRKPIKSALKKSPFFAWNSAYDTLPCWATYDKTRGELLSHADFHAIYCDIANYKLN